MNLQWSEPKYRLMHEEYIIIRPYNSLTYLKKYSVKTKVALMLVLWLSG